jgi:hypothetical protein
MSLPRSNSGWAVGPFRLLKPLPFLTLLLLPALPLALPFFPDALREEVVLDLRAAIV